MRRPGGCLPPQGGVLRPVSLPRLPRQSLPAPGHRLGPCPPACNCPPALGQRVGTPQPPRSPRASPVSAQGTSCCWLGTRLPPPTSSCSSTSSTAATTTGGSGGCEGGGPASSSPEAGALLTLPFPQGLRHRQPLLRVGLQLHPRFLALLRGFPGELPQPAAAGRAAPALGSGQGLLPARGVRRGGPVEAVPEVAVPGWCGQPSPLPALGSVPACPVPLPAAFHPALPLGGLGATRGHYARGAGPHRGGDAHGDQPVRGAEGGHCGGGGCPGDTSPVPAAQRGQHPPNPPRPAPSCAPLAWGRAGGPGGADDCSPSGSLWPLTSSGACGPFCRRRSPPSSSGTW